MGKFPLVVACLVSLLFIQDSGVLAETHNTLTDGERFVGWELLFDGKTMKGWGNKSGSPSHKGWQAKDGELQGVGKWRGNVYTQALYDNFELEFEWKVAGKCDSGVLYRADEDQISLGVEYQIIVGVKTRVPTGSLCHIVHPKGKQPQLHPEQWNKSRIIADGKKIQHWLNGNLLLSTVVGNETWKKAVSSGYHKKNPNIGTSPSGRIAFLGRPRNGPISFRNIMIKRLHASVARKPSPTPSKGHEDASKNPGTPIGASKGKGLTDEAVKVGVERLKIIKQAQSTHAITTRYVFAASVGRLLAEEFIEPEDVAAPLDEMARNLNVPKGFQDWPEKKKIAWGDANTSYVLLPGKENENFDKNKITCFEKPQPYKKKLAIAWEDGRVTVHDSDEARKLVKARTGKTVEQWIKEDPLVQVAAGKTKLKLPPKPKKVDTSTDLEKSIEQLEVIVGIQFATSKDDVYDKSVADVFLFADFDDGAGIVSPQDKVATPKDLNQWSDSRKKAWARENSSYVLVPGSSKDPDKTIRGFEIPSDHKKKVPIVWANLEVTTHSIAEARDIIRKKTGKPYQQWIRDRKERN